MGKLVQLLLLCRSPILGTTSQRFAFYLLLVHSTMPFIGLKLLYLVFSQKDLLGRGQNRRGKFGGGLLSIFSYVSWLGHQGFSFELVPSLENVQWLDAMPKNATPLVDSSLVNDNATLWPQVMKLELQNGTSDDTHVTQSLNKDWNMALHGLLIIVTPTYAQPFQAYYLNRLVHTLKLIPPPLLWIWVLSLQKQLTY
ncbi:unnamed protein product [Camellia sinensis]